MEDVVANITEVTKRLMMLPGNVVEHINSPKKKYRRVMQNLIQ